MAAEEKNWNICKNWGLRCFEQKVTDKCVTLKCSMNKRKEDGSYTKPVFIDVLCLVSKCEIAEDQYDKCFINVDGTFAVDEYVSGGTTTPTLKIFATKVTKKA